MSKYVMPPRQKMINLIYIILIAILAIHISKDAIEGYDIISNDYRPQIAQLPNIQRRIKSTPGAGKAGSHGTGTICQRENQCHSARVERPERKHHTDSR